MLRVSRPLRTLHHHRRRSPQQQQQQSFSTALESDTGVFGTRIHHHMTSLLAVLTPVYFITPDSYTEGMASRLFGLVLSINVAAHSWIGLNYVARDYVPKISAKLAGPARVANLGLAVVTLVGMAKISLAGPGGLKAVVKGVWNGDKKPLESGDKEKF